MKAQDKGTTQRQEIWRDYDAAWERYIKARLDPAYDDYPEKLEALERKCKAEAKRWVDVNDNHYKGNTTLAWINDYADDIDNYPLTRRRTIIKSLLEFNAARNVA